MLEGGKNRRKAHPRHTLPIEAIGVKDNPSWMASLADPCAVALAGAGGVEGGLPGSQEEMARSFLFSPTLEVLCRVPQRWNRLPYY